MIVTTYRPHSPSHGGQFLYTYGAQVHPITLSDILNFEHVIRVNDDATITDDTPGEYAPDLIQWEQPDGTWVEELLSDSWELLTGFTGQYSYSGPMMHASETIGGGLALHIVTHPGFYVALVPSVLAANEEPDGWAVAYKPLKIGA